jgi:hypothetical protein
MPVTKSEEEPRSLAHPSRKISWDALKSIISIMIKLSSSPCAPTEKKPYRNVRLFCWNEVDPVPALSRVNAKSCGVMIHHSLVKSVNVFTSALVVVISGAV